MGWEWEVEAFMPVDNPTEFSPAFLYVSVYTGPSRRKARRAARQAVRDGSGCIRIHWRP